MWKNAEVLRDRFSGLKFCAICRKLRFVFSLCSPSFLITCTIHASSKMNYLIFYIYRLEYFRWILSHLFSLEKRREEKAWDREQLHKVIASKCLPDNILALLPLGMCTSKFYRRYKICKFFNIKKKRRYIYIFVLFLRPVREPLFQIAIQVAVPYFDVFSFNRVTHDCNPSIIRIIWFYVVEIFRSKARRMVSWDIQLRLADT